MIKRGEKASQFVESGARNCLKHYYYLRGNIEVPPIGFPITHHISKEF